LDGLHSITHPITILSWRRWANFWRLVILSLMLWNDELGALTIIIWWWLRSYVSWRCFPHVVNLACKAVLSAITRIEYAAENAGDYVPIVIGPRSTTFAEAITRDPIATLRSLVRGVHMKRLWLSNADLVYRFVRRLFDDNTFQMSSILFTWRIFSFSVMLTPDGRQLSSCWKGLFYSVLWVTSLAYKFRVYLHGWSKAIKEFLEKYKSYFPELCQFMFSAAEWDALQVFQKILEVSWRLSIFGVAHWLTTLYKVPHAFQQQLSFEKTPTLCDAIPSFEAMASTCDHTPCCMAGITAVVPIFAVERTPHLTLLLVFMSFMPGRSTIQVRWLNNLKQRSVKSKGEQVARAYRPCGLVTLSLTIFIMG